VKIIAQKAHVFTSVEKKPRNWDDYNSKPIAKESLFLIKKHTKDDVNMFD